MNKNLTELIFILDRSGSMNGLEDDTIGGYNSLIENQQNEDGDALITTVLFDHKYKLLHDRVNIKEVELMTKRDYRPGGTTALLDAIGTTINHINNQHVDLPECEVPEKTMMVIITDGHENASKEFSLEQVRKMIELQKEKHNWEFLFLGANIDAISTARDFGIQENRAVTYEADSKGTKKNFDALSDVVMCFASKSVIADNWMDSISKYRRDCEDRKA